MNTEEKHPMISIIVPVYNVESYLEKCLDSIAVQTYPNLEVIIVDDASTDQSGRLCDVYAARDARMQVVHLPVNQGVSAARNEAVIRANGKYVTFIDSDDYVEPDLLEKLYVNLIENNADISVCGIGNAWIKKSKISRTYSREETVCCMARRTPFLWNVWGKLYRTEAVKSHPFNRRAFCCEDLLFFYQVLKDAEKVSYFPEPLYHYAYRPGSLINSGIDEKRCTVLSVLNAICAEASVYYPEMVPGLELLALDAAVRLAQQAVESKAAKGHVFFWLKRFQKHIRRHFSWKAIALSRDAKTGAAILMLYASTAIFYRTGTVYKCGKHFRCRTVS